MWCSTAVAVHARCRPSPRSDYGTVAADSGAKEQSKAGPAHQRGYKGVGLRHHGTVLLAVNPETVSPCPSTQLQISAAVERDHGGILGAAGAMDVGA